MNEKELTVQEIGAMVNGRVLGDENLLIRGFAPLESAGNDEISFLTSKKNAEMVLGSGAAALLVPVGVEGIENKVLIEVKDPYLAVAIIHSYFLKKPFQAQGVHPRAFVDEDCTVSKEITIGPMAVIGKRVKIGDRVTIGAGTVVGDDVEIGDDSKLEANVTVYGGSKVGCRVIVHSGTVIGSDGYGYAPNEKGEHVKRPQVGIVRIDDDVEIGANCCIDKAAYGETHIKSGVKIDNLVQVAHNVVVGENSLLVAQVGISGSTTLGRNVVMGGQSATTGHIHIGDRVMIAARGGVHSNQPAGAILGGAPAIPAKQWAKCCAVYNKLPELQSKIKSHSKAIDVLNTSLLEDE